MNQIQTATESRFAPMFAAPNEKPGRDMIRQMVDMMNYVHFENQQSVVDQNRADTISIALEQVERSALIAARQQARTEFARWVREYLDSLTDEQWNAGEGHEGTVGRRFGARYWERLAEIAGVTV